MHHSNGHLLLQQLQPTGQTTAELPTLLRSSSYAAVNAAQTKRKGGQSRSSKAELQQLQEQQHPVAAQLRQQQQFRQTEFSSP